MFVWGFDHIILEGDAQSVVNSINKKERGLSPIFALYDYIHVLSSHLVRFTCSAVRRSGNTVAHLIARMDTGEAHEKICMEPFPPGLLALVDLDLI